MILVLLTCMALGAHAGALPSRQNGTAAPFMSLEWDIGHLNVNETTYFFRMIASDSVNVTISHCDQILHNSTAVSEIIWIEKAWINGVGCKQDKAGYIRINVTALNGSTTTMFTLRHVDECDLVVFVSVFFLLQIFIGLLAFQCVKSYAMKDVVIDYSAVPEQKPRRQYYVANDFLRRYNPFHRPMEY